MALTRIPAPFIFPSAILGNSRIALTSGTGGVAFENIATADAANEKIVAMGHVYWEGAPTSPRTMGSSSKVHFRTYNVTFADAATNVRIGLQDVVGSGGGVAVIQPDGTFDVYADVAGNSGLITSSDDQVVKSITLSTSGSKSVGHGDLIAVAFDMTARGGSDSLILASISGVSGLTSALPTVANYVVGWSTSARVPNILLEDDSGNFGLLYGSAYISNVGTYNYSSSSSPDEYGLVFQVPFRCKVGGFAACVSGNNTASDITFRLYSDPLGTPASMASYSRPGDQGAGGTTESLTYFMLASEITLEPNTDYCLAAEAATTTAIDIGYVTLASAAHRGVLGFANCRLGSRSNGSGAFSETTTEIPLLGVILSAVDDGFGPGRANYLIGL